MAELSNNVFDNGLSHIDAHYAENLHILSADPGLTWANIASYGLGSKAAPAISAPADRTGGGRQVTVSAITDGNGHRPRAPPPTGPSPMIRRRRSWPAAPWTPRSR